LGVAQFPEPGCEDGTVIAKAPGFARRRIGGAFAARPWTVSLEPAATLHGEVRLQGRLLADGIVRLISAANDSLTVDLEKTKGRFKFDQLPAGNYELTVRDKRGQQLNSEKLKLDAGKAQSRIVTLPL
jgi:hypothetical protein